MSNGYTERCWVLAEAQVSRGKLLRFCALGVIDAVGGIPAVLALVVLPLVAIALPPAANGALIGLGAALWAALVFVIAEEYFHAAAVVQLGGRRALRGLLVRHHRHGPFSALAFVAVVYAPALAPSERAVIAAAGPMGAMTVLLLPAIALATALQDPWWLGLAAIGAVNLIPLRALGAGSIASDGDTLRRAALAERYGLARYGARAFKTVSRALAGPIAPQDRGQEPVHLTAEGAS